MNKDNSREVVFVFLLFMAVAAPALSFMLWHQAYDFDPCNNIFTRVPTKCLEPGLDAVLAGSIAIAFGIMMAFCGIRSVIMQASDRILSSLLAWMGLWIVISGLAYAYIGLLEG